MQRASGVNQCGVIVLPNVLESFLSGGALLQKVNRDTFKAELNWYFRWAWMKNRIEVC